VERALGIFAVITIVVAWIFGNRQQNIDIEPYLFLAFPEANHIEQISRNTYEAHESASTDTLLGFITLGEASGYGGPMTVAVGVDLEGSIVGLSVVDQRETPSWFRKVAESSYIPSLFGKTYLDPFQDGEDVDAISGATYTSQAIAQATLAGVREVASEQLGLDVPEVESPRIVFGIPEITLIALYAVGFIGHQKKFKYTKQARWASMIVGLVVLGIIYTRPLTISNINQLLLGFFPQWQTNLYWYLLLGGILFVYTVDNRNPYCDWFCPFGAAQECLGTVGFAKARSPGRFRGLLLWLQRGLAWAAVLLALVFRNPGLTSYEVFGTVFDLTGTTLQFGLLGIVLIASLFIRRPWCTYLCPLRPVTDLYRTFRSWVIELCKRRKKPGTV